MESLCLVCLSNDRKLFRMSTQLAGIMDMILPEIKISKLCWECLASLKHLLKLRKRALRSKEILDKHFKVNKTPLSVQSSSNLGSCYIFTFSLGDNQVIEETKVTKNIEPKLPGNTELQINTELGKGDLGLSKNVLDRKLIKDKNCGDTLKNLVKSTKKKVRSKKKRVVPNKQYNCRECKEKFESRGKYEYHRQKHRGKVICSVCNRNFSSRSSLSTHHSTVHNTTPKDNTFRHYCQLCDKFFKTSCSYSKHLRISARHIDPQLLRYCCPTCGKGFLTCKERDRHNEMVHLQKNKLQCTRCPRQYCSVRALRCHMRRHVGGITKRDYVCEICGIGFKSGQVLKSHQRVHEKEKSQEK